MYSVKVQATANLLLDIMPVFEVFTEKFKSKDFSLIGKCLADEILKLDEDELKETLASVQTVINTLKNAQNIVTAEILKGT